MQFTISILVAVSQLLLASPILAAPSSLTESAAVAVRETASNQAALIGCFSDGVKSGGDNDAGIIAAACQALAGNYDSNTDRSNCQNRGDGNRVDFRIKNTFNHAEVLEVDHCKSNMVLTAEGCTYGGIRATGLFEATYDPNSGRC